MSTMQDIVDEIKLELTGNLLMLEIEDKTIELAIKKALRELQRYWDEETLITVPYAPCIDLSFIDPATGKRDPSKELVSSVVQVYRTQNFGDSTSTFMDPAYAQQWMLFSSGGTMYNLNDYVLNLASWYTLNQIRNTISTDLAFKYDRHNNKLYVNKYSGGLNYITIEYIPKLNKPEDIKSDYWIDILIRLATAYTKVMLGRTRTRFTQNNAIFAMDGEKLLDEGNTELKEMRERLNNNSQLGYPIN